MTHPHLAKLMGYPGCVGGGVCRVVPVSARLEFTLIAAMMLVVVVGWLI